MSEQLTEMKQAARQTWATGDYAAIAERLLVVGDRLVRRVGIGPGDRVLDVACGTGNATIPAAQVGGRVVGVDLTPELFGPARGLAAAAGVEIDWVTGDAEDLPFDDASFDVVLSTFGCMFAPRQEVVAAELSRVLRPGGRLGICSWTAEGAVGDFFATVSAHLPPPPNEGAAPTLWGSEEHVRDLFAGTGIELEFERETVDMLFDSIDHAVDEYATKFGPVVQARELVEPQGGWPALREDFAAMWGRHSAPKGEGIAWRAEYLVVLGRA